MSHNPQQIPHLKKKVFCLKDINENVPEAYLSLLDKI